MKTVVESRHSILGQLTELFEEVGPVTSCFSAHLQTQRAKHASQSHLSAGSLFTFCISNAKFRIITQTHQ